MTWQLSEKLGPSTKICAIKDVCFLIGRFFSRRLCIFSFPELPHSPNLFCFVWLKQLHLNNNWIFYLGSGLRFGFQRTPMPPNKAKKKKKKKKSSFLREADSQPISFAPGLPGHSSTTWLKWERSKLPNNLSTWWMGAQAKQQGTLITGSPPCCLSCPSSLQPGDGHAFSPGRRKSDIWSVSRRWRSSSGVNEPLHW